MDFKINIQNKLQKGFTLVETMVAISILSLAVTGPLLIAQKGVGSAIYARDQITAFYLAQEAVEYIRNVRDSNRISGVPWLEQFTNGPSACKEDGFGRRCQIDSQYSDFANSNAIQACSDSSNPDTDPNSPCPQMKIDSANNIYGYGSGGNWAPTIFTRTISIDDRTKPNQEAEISVTISWNTTLFAPQKTFTIKEYIFNF